MLTRKTLIGLITLGFLAAPVAGDLEFRDPNNVTFYTGLEFPNNNQIYGLGKPTGSKSALRVTDVKDEYYNLSGDTLNGDLNVNDNNINNFFENSCGSNQAVKEIYDNGSVRCGPAGGNSGLPTVLDTNRSLNQDLDANRYQIGNLSEPTENNDAARLQDLGNGTVSRSGDTLAGNLSFNNQYYITDLQNPNKAQDAATKNYVDTNEQVLAESDVENYIFDTGDNTGNLGLNGGNVVDNSGNITLEGDTEVSNGNLNLNSNNVTNSECLGDQC